MDVKIEWLQEVEISILKAQSIVKDTQSRFEMIVSADADIIKALANL